MLVVQPVADSIGQRFPFFLVLEDALPGPSIELLHPEALDIFFSAELQLLFDFDLYRETVGIPTGDPGYRLALHGVEAAHQILDRPREYVVDAGTPIRGWRPLVEDER